VKPVLLDTGPIVAMLDRSERRHTDCVEVVETLQVPMVSCEAVIAEACFLLRNLKGAAEAVLENVEQGIFLVPCYLPGRASKVSRLIKKYADTPMDFADACLVDMASEFGCGQILTLDSDFQIYRWGRNRVFELLIDP
jgi:predicted nucleic acid-binding protein